LSRNVIAKVGTRPLDVDCMAAAGLFLVDVKEFAAVAVADADAKPVELLPGRRIPLKLIWPGAAGPAVLRLLLQPAEDDNEDELFLMLPGRW
jgi:hypothetical protein